jgi:arylsulfatase A-like enzyme
MNFLLLTIDTLRADRLGSYGWPRPLTPNLDRLADTGIRFSQAITGGTWTQAAFPTILTSSYASMYGGCLGALSPGRPSPISALAAQGYATAGFSSNPHLSRQFGYDRGFDHFVDLIPAQTDPRLRSIKGGQAMLRQPITHAILGRLGDLRPGPVYVPGSEVTDSLCRWLDENEAPFFAWAHYMDVHWPYHLDEKLVRPEEVARAWQDLTHYHAAAWQGAPMTAAHQAHYIELYETALAYLDEQIGRLFRCLEANGRLADTAVIVVADHGEEFMDHGRWGHWENNLFDEIIRVPLLISLPGRTTPQQIGRQVSILDVMPTILDLAECPFPPGMEGSSMQPLWSGQGSYEATEEAICEMWRDTWHRIAVRTETFKYIWDSRDPGRPELFNLQADPAEQENIAGRHPAVTGRFQSLVTAHLHRVGQTSPGEVVGEPEIDEALLQRLRGLGYIE